MKLWRRRVSRIVSTFKKLTGFLAWWFGFCRLERYKPLYAASVQLQPLAPII